MTLYDIIQLYTISYNVIQRYITLYKVHIAAQRMAAECEYPM